MRMLLDSDSLGQYGHHFIRATGGHGLAPVVGGGVAEFVQVLDGG